MDDEIVTALRDEIARELRVAQPETIDVNRPLGELGVDSLGLVAVRGAVEARLGRTMTFDLIADNPTILELAARLRAAPTNPADPTESSADAPA